MKMTRSEIMDFILGKSTQMAMLIMLAFPCAARAQTACEAHVAKDTQLSSPPYLKVTAAGAVISFTATSISHLDIYAKTYGGDDNILAMFRRWGCTEMLFILAETGVTVKRIDLGSADSKVLTTCEEKVAEWQAVSSGDRKFSATGTVVSLTDTAGETLDNDYSWWGTEKQRVYVKSWGCTKMLFISAQTGETVKQIDLGSPELPSDKPQVPVGGPFGFKRGMTRAQVIALVGRDSVDTKESEADILVVSSAPKAHPAFDKYILFISPTEGLLKIRASGKTIDTDDTGSELRNAFDDIVKGVTQKYGVRTEALDFCNGGVGCSGEDVWMLGLLEKNRTLATYWDFRNNPVNQITYISVEATALSLNKGWASFNCEFEGWEAYVDSKKAKQNESF
jgi:hypothetical protein